MAETITLMIPYYNYLLEPFEYSIKSIHWQTRPFDEVLISDFGSDEPYQGKMEALCEENGFKYIYTPIDAPPKVKAVHLWMLNYNIGIRNSMGDLVVCSGTDKVYQDNTVECILDFYNWYTENRNRDMMICCGGWNLKRLPEKGETYSDLVEASKWRGGQAYWCATKEWFHKVRGMDESLRWYAELDLIRRAAFDGLDVARLHRSNIEVMIGQKTSCVHIRLHRKSRKLFPGRDVKDIAIRGKKFIHRRTGETSIVRNDETWGILTEKKLNRALALIAGEEHVEL